MDKIEFKEKYHNKWVKYIGGFWQIAKVEYYVTAALYEYETQQHYVTDKDELITIVSIFPYNGKQGDWITLHIPPHHIEEFYNKFILLTEENILKFKDLLN